VSANILLHDDFACLDGIRARSTIHATPHQGQIQALIPRLRTALPTKKKNLNTFFKRAYGNRGPVDAWQLHY
jgi:hypothetical protein